MKPILFGERHSGSAIIEMALAACGVDYERRESPDWHQDPARDAFIRHNPLAQSPTLVLENGQVLTESAAILVHLGLSHPTSGLLPGDERARARCLNGLVFLAANVYPVVGIDDYPERWTLAQDAESWAALRQGARQRGLWLWEVFVDRFAATPYLSGERPGALDFQAVVLARWLEARDHLSRCRPAFVDILERIETYPHVAAVCRRHWPA